jgi:hypothetical protein
MKTRKGRLAIAFVVAGLFLATQARAQFWEKKDYRQWSQTDCQRLLNDSPWASSYMIGTVVMNTVNQMSAVPGRDSAPNVTYTAQFLSAKPVRQAMMRLQQLDPKYAKLSAEQKQVFEERSAKFLESEFPETIVIRVQYSGSQALMLPVARYWGSTPQKELIKRFYLIGAQGRIAPLQVVVASGGGAEIQVIFPRRFNGEPIMAPGLKELRLEIDDPVETASIPYKVQKMMLGGELVY